MDLFEYARRDELERQAPLAARMRPRTLDELVGQEQIVGPGKLLRRAIEADRLGSIILWGPTAPRMRHTKNLWPPFRISSATRYSGKSLKQFKTGKRM